MPSLSKVLLKSTVISILLILVSWRRPLHHPVVHIAWDVLHTLLQRLLLLLLLVVGVVISPSPTSWTITFPVGSIPVPIVAFASSIVLILSASIIGLLIRCLALVLQKFCYVLHRLGHLFDFIISFF